MRDSAVGVQRRSLHDVDELVLTEPRQVDCVAEHLLPPPHPPERVAIDVTDEAVITSPFSEPPERYVEKPAARQVTPDFLVRGLVGCHGQQAPDHLCSSSLE